MPISILNLKMKTKHWLHIRCAEVEDIPLWLKGKKNCFRFGIPRMYSHVVGSAGRFLQNILSVFVYGIEESNSLVHQ